MRSPRSRAADTGPGGSGAAGPRALGRAGEDLAAAWYEARGYTVLERNWRCELGEIDLVCATGTVLVVCEVKARSTDRYGAPAEAVGRAKQLRLRRLCARYLVESGRRAAQVRFDVACVLAGELSVVTAAF